jgi:hypothetical protein
MTNPQTPRPKRCTAFVIRFSLLVIATACIVALAASLLKETRAYIEDRRIPVMLPTGGAKF